MLSPKNYNFDLNFNKDLNIFTSFRILEIILLNLYESPTTVINMMFNLKNTTPKHRLDMQGRVSWHNTGMLLCDIEDAFYGNIQ